MGLKVMPIWSAWWLALVGALLLGLLAYGSLLLRRKKVPARWVACLAALRVLAIALFMLCLLRPVWTRSKSAPHKPDLLVLLDASRSMGWNESGAPDPRLGDALDGMRASGLKAALDGSFNVHWFAFDRDSRPLPPGDIWSLKATGDSTHIGRSMETAWDYYRLVAPQGSAAAGGRGRVLLVSDGNDLSGEDPVDAASRLGVAVYTLPPREAPEPHAAPRVSVTGLQGSGTVLLGSECRFLARIRRDGPVTGPVTLELTEDGEPVMTHQVVLGPEDLERQVHLSHRPTSIGRKTYELAARPTQGGPAFEPGRPHAVTVHVVARSHQVLILEDAWRWEFKFLRRVLEDDPNFAFTAFLSRRPGIYIQCAEPGNTVSLGGFPQSGAELDWFDIVILGDVNPAEWPSGLVPALYSLVVERGKSLVVIAGPGIARLAQVPALERLLPVELPAGSGFTEGPVAVRPSPDAAASPLFYTPEGGGALAPWADLPPMDQVYAPLRKRPAASILLEASEHRNAFGNLIVVAEHTVGRGRVLYVGTDTLWKWQMLAPEDEEGRTPYRIFWQQALRALAPVRPTDGAVDLWLQTDRSRYATSETVRVRAELQGQRPLAGALVEAVVTLPDGRQLPAALTPDADKAHVFVAQFEAAWPGRYSIAARASLDSKTIAETSTVIDVEPAPGEMAHRSNNQPELQRLAARTGGKVVRLAERDTWPAPAASEVRMAQQVRTHDMWGDFSLLFALTAVLALDWLLRLLRGFV